MRYKVEAVVEVDGVEETLAVSVDGRDVRAWEARHDESFTAKQLTHTKIAELAFFAAARSGAYAGGYDSWMSDCVWAREVSDAQEVEADTRPTRKARGGGSRSR